MHMVGSVRRGLATASLAVAYCTAAPDITTAGPRPAASTSGLGRTARIRFDDVRVFQPAVLHAIRAVRIARWPIAGQRQGECHLVIAFARLVTTMVLLGLTAGNSI
jgi:hypothetical protein